MTAFLGGKSYVIWILAFCCIGLLLIQIAKAQDQQTCPIFGTNEPSRLSRSTRERIFLNFEAPSQCRGNVTSWRFCYYRAGENDDDDDDDDYNGGDDFAAKFIVYRRESPSSSNYRPVPGSITTKQLEYRDLSRFGCLDETSIQQFEIQENDVIGACIMDIRGINPLYLVGGIGRSVQDQKLYQYDRSSYDDCTTFQIGLVDTSHDDFRLRDRFKLHLFANIAVATGCRAGNNPPASTALTTSISGTYLNTMNPAQCSDHITKWHYCYYQTSSLRASTTYSMTVAVWRFDSQTSMYNVVQGSTRTVTLQPIQTLAKIFCIEKTLNESDYVQVMQGDVIGVVLPSSSPIPVVGTNAGSNYALQRHSQNSNAINLLNSEFRTQSQAVLHLYASIESIPTVPTTTQKVDVTTMTADITTMGADTTTMALDTTTRKADITTTREADITTREADITTMRADITTRAVDITTRRTDITTTREADITTRKAGITTIATTGLVETLIMPTTGIKITSDMAETEITSATTAPAVGSEDNQGQEGLRTGDIVAVILSVGIVVVILISVTLLLLYSQRKRKRPALSGGIVNATYQAGNVHVNIDPSDTKYEEIEETYEFIPEPYTYSLYALPQVNKVNSDYYSPIECVHDYQKQLKEVKEGLEQSKQEDPYHNPASDEKAIYSQLQQNGIVTIPGDSIQIGQVLGSGQFGTVYKGSWNQTLKSPVDVAIKALKSDATQMDRIKFLQEAAIMAQFKHPNVVALYGLVNKNTERMIVVELLSKGDLLQFLKELRPDPGEMTQASTPQLLLQFSQQISLGMKYLSGKGFIHRDLAARNILIAETDICKIADFGMSRDLQDEDYYVSSGGKIPLKWTAPEAIHYKKYSTASDVWSYGCVLYEIWSLGHKPFEGVGNMEILRRVGAGERLHSPPGCPKRVYELMIQCWADKAAERPQFRDILLSLLENEALVLTIPPEAKASHPQAAMLGAPLEAGKDMYREIQTIYEASNQ